jgi:hypothetical protein
MDIRRVVGKNVRRYRIEAGLSQESWLPAWASNKVTSADSKRGSAIPLLLRFGM